MRRIDNGAGLLAQLANLLEMSIGGNPDECMHAVARASMDLSEDERGFVLAAVCLMLCDVVGEDKLRGVIERLWLEIVWKRS